MKYIDAEKLIAEIDRRWKSNLDAAEKFEKSQTVSAIYGAAAKEAYDILAIIEEFQQEQPELPNNEMKGIPGRDFIPIDWVEACERYGKWKIVSQEQPEVDFETEYAKFSNDTDALDYAFPIDLADYKDFAHHFYELGLKARK